MSHLLAITIILTPLALALAGVFIWIRHFAHKIGVTPVEEPMLRSPGESLRERIDRLNEDLFEAFIGVAVAPLFFAFGYYGSLPRFSDPRVAACLFAICSFVAVFYAGRKGYKTMAAIRNYRLGYAGECLVAERLKPLLRGDCYIFHDVPADGHGNIDHVVVTPTKLYAIETKTRRKRLSPETHRYEAQVTYDGRSLIYPHGREDFGLDQARRQARWLSRLLSEHLCCEVKVQPVLTLPGWMVDRTGRGDVAVVNPKQLPALMRERSAEPISEESRRRMEQMRVVLEKRCRNVPFPGVEVAHEAKKAAQRVRLKQRRKDAGAAKVPVSRTSSAQPAAPALSAR